MFSPRKRKALLALPLALVVILAVGVRLDRDEKQIEERYATPPSKFVEVDGLRVHYRDRGQGAPIVLVHGSNSSLFTWEPWAEKLAARHRVITLDMPGHGLTGPDEKERYSAREMAEVLDRFATVIGVERFTIGGNSMGGNVAWHYAVLHPARVERLILVDAAGLPRREPRPLGFRLYSTPVIGQLVRWISPRFMVAKSVRDTYGDPARVTEAQIDRYDDFLLRAGNREATRLRFRKGDDDLWQRLGEIRVPTLILWGARDRWILPAYGDEFHAKIVGSTLVTLEGLGHIPMEEEPTRSLVPVEAFLAK